MDETTYAELVLEQLHQKTLDGKIKWKIDRDFLLAEPISSIRVRISFKDKGPSSAEWERVYITHPVGDGAISVENPAARSAKFAEMVASGKTLERVNQLFERLLLAPRLKQFEAAMAELTRP